MTDHEYKEAMSDVEWGLETYEGEVFVMSEELCREMASTSEDYTLVINRGAGWMEVS